MGLWVLAVLFGGIVIWLGKNLRSKIPASINLILISWLFFNFDGGIGQQNIFRIIEKDFFSLIPALILPASVLVLVGQSFNADDRVQFLVGSSYAGSIFVFVIVFTLTSFFAINQVTTPRDVTPDHQMTIVDSTCVGDDQDQIRFYLENTGRSPLMTHNTTVTIYKYNDGWEHIQSYENLSLSPNMTDKGNSLSLIEISEPLDDNRFEPRTIAEYILQPRQSLEGGVTYRLHISLEADEIDAKKEFSC